jgi:hypothetical protein
MEIVRRAGSSFDFDDSAARRLIEDVLSRPLFAHLSTASDEGPRESPVWFLWEEGELWIIGNRKTDSFPNRIAREPRCAVGVVAFDPATGLVRHVGFRGRAYLEPHDAGRMKRLLGRYMGDDAAGWDARFAAIVDDEDYGFVRFVPETAVARDQSYEVKGDGRP